jgi:formiminotetrahydrofolate cyclodeaminase
MTVNNAIYDSSTTIEDFLAATAARQPTPGGGSVGALVGALAAATGEMVLNYSVGKKSLEAFADELKPALAELTRARQMLLQLMVEDQIAYDALTAVRKLPPESPERKAQMPAALLACVRVPEAIAATAVGILECCDRVANFVNFNLLSDLAVSSDLAMAAVRCAIYNVKANLKNIEDAAERKSIEGTISRVLGRGLTLVQSLSPRIWERERRGV